MLVALWWGNHAFRGSTPSCDLALEREEKAPSKPACAPSPPAQHPDTGERHWGLEVGRVLDALDVPSPASTAGSGESGPSGQVMAGMGTGNAGERAAAWKVSPGYAVHE